LSPAASQAYLVHDFRYGMALSALMLGGWYVGLSWLLWRQLAEGMRLLTEAFLALGVIFASLAIPLGLDPNWTAAAWALEGAAMVWVGSRQDRPLARLFGLLLQIGAAVSFVDGLVLPANSGLLVNWAFLGSALLASAALFSSFWLDRYRDQASPWELPTAITARLGVELVVRRRLPGSGPSLEGQTLPPAFLLYAG
jgi:Predicted membrane protein